MKQFAGQLVSQDHYEKAGIDDRLQRVLDRWTRLRQAMMEYRSRLGESQTLQDFSRDAEEIEAWIADKLAAASDEPVKETQNLQVRIHHPSPPQNHSRVYNHNKHLEMYIYRRKNYK